MFWHKLCPDSIGYQWYSEQFGKTMYGFMFLSTCSSVHVHLIPYINNTTNGPYNRRRPDAAHAATPLPATTPPTLVPRSPDPLRSPLEAEMGPLISVLFVRSSSSCGLKCNSETAGSISKI